MYSDPHITEPHIPRSSRRWDAAVNCAPDAKSFTIVLLRCCVARGDEILAQFSVLYNMPSAVLKLRIPYFPVSTSKDSHGRRHPEYRPSHYPPLPSLPDRSCSPNDQRVRHCTGCRQTARPSPIWRCLRQLASKRDARCAMRNAQCAICDRTCAKDERSLVTRYKAVFRRPIDRLLYNLISSQVTVAIRASMFVVNGYTLQSDNDRIPHTILCYRSCAAHSLSK